MVFLFSNSDDMSFNTIDLNNINLGDDNFDEEVPETMLLFMLDLWLGVIDLSNAKHAKKT